MPTEAELVLTYNVSRQTVRRAFQDLVAEGLVYRVPGRGTFATDFSKGGRYLRTIGTIEDLEAFAGTEIEIIEPMYLKADEEVAGRLDLPSGGVATLVYRRLYEEAPFNQTASTSPPCWPSGWSRAGTYPTVVRPRSLVPSRGSSPSP